MKSLVLLVVCFAYVNGCYYNAQCPYGLFASKTPYDTVRGDIRDHEIPANCEAVSLWTINRHGNRNPGTSVTEGMRHISRLKDEIIASYAAGTSQLCAEDIDRFRVWTWNSTLDHSQSYLTGTGYEELYNIGKRIREKYPHLLQGTADQFYFRPTNEQRTITSCMAFVHGVTDGTNLDVTVENARERDSIIRPYEVCDRYQQEVKEGPVITQQLATYFTSPDYVAVIMAVQQRLGVTKQLSAENIFSIYELCRFGRSWTDNLQSPWCAAFTNDDLIVLEYYDDVRHYYRNGHGSWVNENLGKIPMKDLYESLEAVVSGGGRKMVGYFTHDTMIEMIISALGLYTEDGPLDSTYRDPKRVWRTSYIGAFSVNVMAVLNSCTEGSSQAYKVQIFINEKETTICPADGCTWAEFLQKFQAFNSSNLDFCSMDYEYTPPEGSVPNRATSLKGILNW